jgi:hypothetical protein
VLLKFDRRAAELGFFVVDPVGDGKALRVGAGEVTRLLRRVTQSLGRQVEENGVLSRFFESEASAAAIGCNRKSLFAALATQVCLHALLPQAAAAVGDNQAKGRILCSHSDVSAAGQQLHNRVP